ncbi:WD-40 repeat protein [Reticulomyxa filosa]|uniref:WD-40 repeat protein n=1 Tax=Reticulomyxa filosa TaxID=46433 RepID=X6MKG7_RETFI|nr:WD-40 repeat protein [Reticulomyxa filosa]|eukprot:ETO14146.1 WD-40 repeat protein [Reticulomyxa filosa]
MNLTYLLSIMLVLVCFWLSFRDNKTSKYATTVFMLDTFCSSSKLVKTFIGHNDFVYSIDYATFDSYQFICSGSEDKTVRVWDVETSKQIKILYGHLSFVSCVKFSPYHYHNNRRNVICSSSADKTIRFWDVKNNQQFQIFNGHTCHVYGIEFSPFNSGRYLCSGSYDNTIRLWDVKTSNLLHVFNGHKYAVCCVDFSPLQSSTNNNGSNSIGVIGGNGYTICSGSYDNTIRIWDIETAKQLLVFKGHEHLVRSVKYGPNEVRGNGGSNTILSGSRDKSVRLWDIQSGKQIQVFNRHAHTVTCVAYSPFIVNNIKFGCDSTVICSGSSDKTIRFWDIRSNKKELYVINGDDKDGRVLCLKFLQIKRKPICVIVRPRVLFVFGDNLFNSFPFKLSNINIFITNYCNKQIERKKYIYNIMLVDAKKKKKI